MAFELPKLSYAYNALEPIIDEETMKLHHDKHFDTYTTKLNEALVDEKVLSTQSIESILTNLDKVPEKIRTAVKNNGGGYINHKQYFEVMTPGGTSEPISDLKKMVEKTFGTTENLKTLFNKEALGRFGSGWAWLVVNENKGLEIMSTQNQDSPLSSGLTPIMGIDVWEHAYYLKYNNRRAEYVEKWWNLINWDIVSKKYDES